MPAEHLSLRRRGGTLFDRRAKSFAESVDEFTDLGLRQKLLGLILILGIGLRNARPTEIRQAIVGSDPRENGILRRWRQSKRQPGLSAEDQQQAKKSKRRDFHGSASFITTWWCRRDRLRINLTTMVVPAAVPRRPQTASIRRTVSNV